MGHAGRLWRDRAQSARKQAAQVSDPDTKRQMLDIAAGYDQLACYLDEQAGRSALSTRFIGRRS